MLKKILLFLLIQKYAKLAREWASYFQVLKWSLCIHSIHKKTTIQNLEEHGHIAHFAIIIIFLFFIFFLQKYTFPYKYTKLFSTLLLSSSYTNPRPLGWHLPLPSPLPPFPPGLPPTASGLSPVLTVQQQPFSGSPPAE